MMSEETRLPSSSTAAAPVSPVSDPNRTLNSPSLRSSARSVRWGATSNSRSTPLSLMAMRMSADLGEYAPGEYRSQVPSVRGRTAEISGRIKRFVVLHENRCRGHSGRGQPDEAVGTPAGYSGDDRAISRCSPGSGRRRHSPRLDADRRDDSIAGPGVENIGEVDLRLARRTDDRDPCDIYEQGSEQLALGISARNEPSDRGKGPQRARKLATRQLGKETRSALVCRKKSERSGGTNTQPVAIQSNPAETESLHVDDLDGARDFGRY